jgi:hypothetical protein
MDSSYIKNSDTLAANFARVAFRDVTNAVDYRTVIASLIPKNTFLVNSAPYLMKIRGTTQDEAFILAVLSSIPLDWYARRFVVLHVNFHIFNGLPIPNLHKSSVIYQRIISLVAALTQATNENNEWVESLNTEFEMLKSDASKEMAQYEIDALIAIAYGLDNSDITHIFNTFHKTWDYIPRLTQVLNFSKKWIEADHD